MGNLYENLSIASKASGQKRKVILEDTLSEFNADVEFPFENAENYCHRGGLLFLLERFDEAIADVTEATRLSPGYAAAYFGRGRIYNKMEKFDKAITDLRTATDLDPQYARAYAHLGDTLRELGHTDESREKYEYALHLVENIHIQRWIADDFAIGIRAQRGLKKLDSTIKFDVNYEYEAVNRQILTQQQIDNMI